MATSITSKSCAPKQSFDVYLPIEEGTSKHVHLQILQGDITQENTQAVVVFSSQDGTTEGDSLRLLQAAGDKIEAEYQAAKAQGGRNEAKGVVLTGAGDLAHPLQILHLSVDDNRVKLRETIVTALHLAEKHQLKSIAFPPLPCQICSVELVKIMVDSFNEFTVRDRPICLHFIQVVVSTSGVYFQYMDVQNRGLSLSCTSMFSLKMITTMVQVQHVLGKTVRKK